MIFERHRSGVSFVFGDEPSYAHAMFYNSINLQGG